MPVLVLILLAVILVTAILFAAAKPAHADHAGLRFREGQPVSPAEPLSGRAS